jgi:hypothetical protein
MTLAFSTFLLIIDLGPSTLKAASVSPLVHGRTQMLITGTTEFHPVNLARLETDRCRACITLQRFMIFESPTVITAFAQKPRP